MKTRILKKMLSISTTQAAKTTTEKTMKTTTAILMTVTMMTLSFVDIKISWAFTETTSSNDELSSA